MVVLFRIVASRSQVLDECSAVTNVEDLETSTDGENGEIAFEGGVDQIEFDLVTSIVRRIGFRFHVRIVTFRVYIRPTH